MYNLGGASANIRTLLPSRYACHLPPQGGLITQGGLSKIKSSLLFYMVCVIIVVVNIVVQKTIKVFAKRSFHNDK